MYLLLNNNKYLSQIVESLLFCLIYNNKECKLISKIDKLDEVNIFIIFNFNNIKYLPKNFIIYNFEQLCSSKNINESYYEKCKHAKVIFDYSVNNIKVYESKNLNCYHLPFGWTPVIEPINIINFDNKNIDLIFLGNINKRRLEIIKNFDIYHSDKCFESNYENICSHAKFSLNIHYYKGESILEVSRIIPLICRGIIVITEKSDDIFYDDIFKDICIFVDFDDINNIKNIIKNFSKEKAINNKNILIEKLNYLKIITDKINLF
tara:strand:+ start:144 stop:935 length:792 start_codon:yes stop_codon:yes gene_type:complete